MTLHQFHELDELEQWQTVWDSEPIANRVDETCRYELYQVDQFYVEVKYRKEKVVFEEREYDVRIGMRSFSSAEEFSILSLNADIKMQRIKGR